VTFTRCGDFSLICASRFDEAGLPSPPLSVWSGDEGGRTSRRGVGGVVLWPLDFNFAWGGRVLGSGGL